MQATFRWCISSPAASPRATIPLRGTPPPLRRALPRAGPRTSAIQRSRARTSASLPPKRITLPSPSLRVQQARFPNVRFSITITGIPRVTTPVMGPTASWWWLGERSTPPPAASASASSRSRAHPSSTAAPATAPRIGPHIRLHSTGGPAWRSRRSRMPGTASSAGSTSTSTGSPRSIRSTASPFAASIRSPAAVPASSRSARASATGSAAGGDPLDVRHLDPCRLEVRRELLEPDVHYPQGPRQQVLHAPSPAPEPPSGGTSARASGSHSPGSKSSRKRSSTRAATSASASVMDSAGWWLIPSLQRTKSIPTAVRCAIAIASWPAPLGSSRTSRPLPPRSPGQGST